MPNVRKPTIRLFVSHSKRDETIAKTTAELFQLAFGLAVENIRCTSVAPYQLSSGVSIDDALRHEAHDAESFVAIITRNSIRSRFVFMELGARWGSGKEIRALLAGGFQASELPPPLSFRHAVQCDTSASIHRLVADVAEDLKASPPNAALCQSKIEDLLDVSKTLAEPLPPSVEELFQQKLLPFVREFQGDLERLLNDRETKTWREAVRPQRGIQDE